MNKNLINLSILLLAVAGFLTIAEHLSAGYPKLVPFQLIEWLHIANPYIVWMLLAAIFLAVLAGHRLADELAELHSRVVRISEQVADGEATLTTRLESINDLGPKISEWQSRLDQNDARLRLADNELALLRGQVAFSNRDYNAALRHFMEGANQVEPALSTKRWLGLCLLRLNSHGLAIKHLLEVASISQDGADFALLGNAYQGAAMHREASEAYAEAIQRGCPNKNEIATRMGDVLRSVNSTEAETILFEQFKKNPANTAAAMHLAKLMSKSGRLDAALKILNESIEANPKAWSAYPMRARILARRSEAGDWDAALRDLEVASQNNPANNLNYVTAAELYLKRAIDEPDKSKRLGSWREAENWALRGVRSVNRTASGEILLRLARARLHLGKVDEAIVNIEDAKSAYKGGTHIGQYWLTLWIALALKPSWNRLSKAVSSDLRVEPAETVFQHLFVLACALAMHEDAELDARLSNLLRSIKIYSTTHTGASFSPTRDATFKLVSDLLSTEVSTSSVRLRNNGNKLIAQWIRGEMESTDLLIAMET